MYFYSEMKTRSSIGLPLSATVRGTEKNENDKDTGSVAGRGSAWSRAVCLAAKLKG